MLCLYQLFLNQTLPLPTSTHGKQTAKFAPYPPYPTDIFFLGINLLPQTTHHPHPNCFILNKKLGSSSLSKSTLRAQTNSPKAKQRLGDTVRERIRSTEITHKASISKKGADDAAVEASVPEAQPFPPATTRSGLTCRLFLNPHAKIRIQD